MNGLMQTMSKSDIGKLGSGLNQRLSDYVKSLNHQATVCMTVASLQFTELNINNEVKYTITEPKTSLKNIMESDPCLFHQRSSPSYILYTCSPDAAW